MDTDKQSRPAAPEPGRRDVSATPEVKKTVSAPDVVSDPLEAIRPARFIPSGLSVRSPQIGREMLVGQAGTRGR